MDTARIQPPTVKQSLTTPVIGCTWYVTQTVLGEHGRTVTTYLNNDGQWREDCFADDRKEHGYYVSEDVAKQALQNVSDGSPPNRQ